MRDYRITPMKGEPEDALRLRITVVDPPKGVLLKMQRGREQLVDPAVSAAHRVSFDFEVRLGTRAGGLPNFLGDFAQGPADKRFVYINSGTLAGQSDSPWSRRAKIPLTAISTALIAQARRTGGVLAAEYEGTARDGGPSCATVPLIGGDWHVEPE
jgi:uncharacterized protein DUF5990